MLFCVNVFKKVFNISFFFICISFSFEYTVQFTLTFGYFPFAEQFFDVFATEHFKCKRTHTAIVWFCVFFFVLFLLFWFSRHIAKTYSKINYTWLIFFTFINIILFNAIYKCGHFGRDCFYAYIHSYISFRWSPLECSFFLLSFLVDRILTRFYIKWYAIKMKL